MSTPAPPLDDTDLAAESSPSTVGARTTTLVVLGLVGGLILAANLGGNWMRSHGFFLMWVNAPPLTGTFDPRVSPGSIVVVLVGVLSVWWAERLASHLGWRSLLWASFGAALLWATALALWDGSAGIIGPAQTSEDYSRTVSLVGDDPASFVRTYVADLRVFSTHGQAHPPGMVLVLWGMDRTGFGGAWWEGALELAVGSASVPAVLLAVRDVGDERLARAAAPFLILGPIALEWSSGDAVFLGVGAWAVAWLVLATGRSGRRADGLALAGGALGGLGLLLSYGIVPLGLVPLTVIVGRRRWRVAALAAVAAAIPLSLAWAAGFSWVAGLQATRDLYHQGIASRRPQSYFVWANVAALAVALGPAVWVGLARLRHRGTWLLVGGAFAAIAIADVSGLSKAEVERIWLPFMPWLVAGAGVGLIVVSARSRRTWLTTQVVWAIAVQLLVRSPT